MSDITFEEVMQVLNDRLEGHRWMRRQLRDEYGDIRNDPQCQEFLPQVTAEIEDVTARIDELEKLIACLEDDVEEMRMLDELDERMFA